MLVKTLLLKSDFTIYIHKRFTYYSVVNADKRFTYYSAVNADKNMVFIGKTNFTALTNIS